MRSLIPISVLLFCASTPILAQKNAPQEKSTVNKEYDENGNLIQFDSTYVWQWNSDSTFNFSPDNNLDFGNHFQEFFGEFNADSILQQFGFSNKDMLMPFGEEDFFSHFQHSIPDSMFIGQLDDLQKQLLEKFNQQNLVQPEIKSQNQKEDWDKLMQKQQKEQEEMMKKWKEK